MNLIKELEKSSDSALPAGEKQTEIVQESGESYAHFLNRRAAEGRDPDGISGVEVAPGRENDRDFIENFISNDISERIKASVRESAMNPVNMQTLFGLPYKEKVPVIEGILNPGTYILAGASKSGKSLLAYQITYHVSKGSPMWGHEVKKPGTVLYLALEDDLNRVRSRYARMFGENPTEKLEIATRSGDVEGDLITQLVSFARTHRDLQLIIIDTLQKVRRSGSSYQGDYETISGLKAFADRFRICLILVHHTRKNASGDIFDMISGSTGLMGSADGAYLLQKEERTDLNARLDFTGRDSADKRFNLKRNLKTLTWELISEDDELWRKPPDEVLEELAEIVKAFGGSWKGTATELAGLMEYDSTPNALSRHLSKNADRLKEEYGIIVTGSRTKEARILTFSMPGDDNDDNDDISDIPCFQPDRYSGNAETVHKNCA
ncbi:MAG: AAA family ATPase [Oscillospiraceae bacterium]|nr:AAA family ATPase [Oscillospiraceae bacterium]